jgi:hypothetical protein
MIEKKALEGYNCKRKNDQDNLIERKWKKKHEDQLIINKS